MAFDPLPIPPAAGSSTAGKRIRAAWGELVRLALLDLDTRVEDIEDATVSTGSGAGASQSTFLVSGGQIAWNSAYTFTVSAAVYYIAGTRYESDEQQITLDASHATLNRIDVIAVDYLGDVVKVSGTAASQPSEPDTDPQTQLKLGIVTVDAATAAPSTTTTSLYAENLGSGSGEWNWTTSGSGFTLGSTNNPRTGTKTIEGTTVANGAYAQGEKGSGTIDPGTVDRLTFYLRSKAAWNNNRVLRVSLMNAGIVKGTPLTVASGYWGFDSGIVGSYQLISIPMTQFAVPPGTLINQLRIADSGGSIGFYIDDISFQTGGFSGTTAVGITQEQADARYLKRGNNLSDVSSAASATAALNAMVGDSGSGGTKGLVPAPGAGDTAAGRFLRADGAFAVPTGTSTGTVTTTGSPSSGNLTKFSGASSITSGDLSGDVTTSGTLAVTIANDAVTNAKSANMADSTIKGRAVSAGTGDPTDLTATQATAILNAVVGDSGSGGTKGLVPAPGSGDSAAGKFLKADGTFAVPGITTGSPTGGGYVLVNSWTFSTNVTEVDFNNLSAYSEIMVITRGITKSVSATLAIRMSTDNGSSFYAGASDYQILGTDGTETNASSMSLYTTNTTAARTGLMQICGFNVASTPKQMWCANRSSVFLFVGSTSALNAIRLFPANGGNLTAGNIYVLGR